MKGLPDKAFDLAIVDPPYGISVNMNMGRRKGKRKRHEDKDWDESIPTADYFMQLARVSKEQIIWGGNYFPLPQSKCFIIWDKAETMYGRDFAECEFAWGSFNKSARIFKMNPNQIDRIHPTQKPIKLYKWLLKNYAKPGDKILDTHGGSMSIAIACHEMGFDLTLCEIDKDYYEAGVKRVHDAMKQQKLFNYTA
jgi:site-specific DNA-methyltransferase (adenine-specific)